MSSPLFFPHSFPPYVVGTVSSYADWQRMTSSREECDIFEWRIDALLSELTREDILSYQTTTPLLITVRCPEEGGCQPQMTLKDRQDLYRLYLPKAAAIDIEIAYLEPLADIVALAHKFNIPVIASAHQFQTSFSLQELTTLTHKALSLGANLVKFAHRLPNLQALHESALFLEQTQQKNLPIALMGMGELGPVSRLLFSQLGSSLIYGFLGKTANAPGQWSSQNFKYALNLLSPVQ